jgi:protein SCO1/2
MASGLLEVGDPVPDAAFIDQRDQRRSFAEWHGSLTLVTFIYTRCPLPTFCPLMDQNFATLQGALAEDPRLAGQVQLVSVTFDPAHDTPEVLAAHAAKRRADPDVWTFLTGDQTTIERFAGRFGVGVLREDDSAEIAHNLRTTLIDRDGRVRKVFSGSDWTPGAVLADLRAALGSS